MFIRSQSKDRRSGKLVAKAFAFGGSKIFEDVPIDSPMSLSTLRCWLSLMFTFRYHLFLLFMLGNCCYLSLLPFEGIVYTPRWKVFALLCRVCFPSSKMEPRSEPEKKFFVDLSSKVIFDLPDAPYILSQQSCFNRRKLLRRLKQRQSLSIRYF